MPYYRTALWYLTVLQPMTSQATYYQLVGYQFPEANAKLRPDSRWPNPAIAVVGETIAFLIAWGLASLQRKPD